MTITHSNIKDLGTITKLFLTNNNNKSRLITIGEKKRSQRVSQWSLSENAIELNQNKCL